MQKQTFSLAASVALVLAMSSVGQAQSYFAEPQNYGQVQWSEQEMVQPASVTPVGVPVGSFSAYTPAPSIPLGKTQLTTNFAPPARPVLNAFPKRYMPPAKRVYPPVQQFLPTTMMQPVCTSGG